MIFHRLAISVPTLALILSAAPAQAGDKPCTDATLRGSYAFTARGATFPVLGLPAPLTGAFASSGYAEYDGKGRVALTATSSFNGAIQPAATIPGTYSVNEDCSFTSQLANGVNFRSVIVNGGRELFILQTTKGVAITGTAQARDRGGEDESEGDSRARACSAATLAGSYGFIAEGAAGAPTLPGVPIGPLAGVGVVTLKADGTFQMMAQRSVAGNIDPSVLPLAGKFTAGPNCTFKMVFDVGFHFDATAIGNSGAVFVETDPGTALIVKARRI